MNGHHLSSTTDFTRQHARKPSTPPNRPNPLCFTPPNGRDWKIRMQLYFNGNLKRYTQVELGTYTDSTKTKCTKFC